MIPYIKEQIRLSRVIERMLGTVFSPRADDSGSEQHRHHQQHQQEQQDRRRQALDRLNVDLAAWKSELPGWADFNTWEFIDEPLKPSTAALQ